MRSRSRRPPESPGHVVDEAVKALGIRSLALTAEQRRMIARRAHGRAVFADHPAVVLGARRDNLTESGTQVELQVQAMCAAGFAMSTGVAMPVPPVGVCGVWFPTTSDSTARAAQSATPTVRSAPQWLSAAASQRDVLVDLRAHDRSPGG